MYWYSKVFYKNLVTSKKMKIESLLDIELLG